jgi:multidrug transporter EmrE-like cation transporter
MIRGAVLGMIVASVSCSALAQLALKHGMSTVAVQQSIAGGRAPAVAWAIAGSPTVWIGLVLYGLGAAIWLFVLANLDLSVAYAFVALGFLLTMALGCIVLGEPFTARKLAGTCLVIIGIWIVSNDMSAR